MTCVCLCTVPFSNIRRRWCRRKPGVSGLQTRREEVAAIGVRSWASEWMKKYLRRERESERHGEHNIGLGERWRVTGKRVFSVGVFFVFFWRNYIYDTLGACNNLRCTPFGRRRCCCYPRSHRVPFFIFFTLFARSYVTCYYDDIRSRPRINDNNIVENTTGHGICDGRVARKSKRNKIVQTANVPDAMSVDCPRNNTTGCVENNILEINRPPSLHGHSYDTIMSE